MDEPSKPCSTCGKTWPLTEFYPIRKGSTARMATCKPCKRAASARYRAEHADYYREYLREYQQTHKEELAAKKRRRREAGPEIFREQARRAYRKNRQHYIDAAKAYYAAQGTADREAAKKRVKAWNAANRETVRSYFRKRRAVKSGAKIGIITAELLETKLAYWGWRCWIKGPACTLEPETWDHVKPLSKGGAHMLANLRPACRKCNNAKRARWPLVP